MKAAAEQAARSLSRKLETSIAMFHGEGVALVVGCLRPVILVNASLLSGLTPVQLEQILAHELAHVYRFDPLTQLVQRLIESLLFFHPGVWYVSRTASDLREFCCDELATQNYPKVDFAETLLQCAVLSRSNKAARYSLAATGSHSSQLTSRIDALLQSKSSGEHRKARRWSDAPAATKVALTLIGTLIVLVAIRTTRESGLSPMQILSDPTAENTASDNAVEANPVVPTDLDWQWITEEPDSVVPGQFLFGGKQLSLVDSIPEDVDVQAMVDDDACKFTQWHFGDSSSTPVAILVEMNGNVISRLFIDRNRDRIIDESEVITIKATGDKTWLTGLQVEVHENGSVVRSNRQIGMTLNRDRTKIRITTLGFAEGQIEVGDETYPLAKSDTEGAIEVADSIKNPMSRASLIDALLQGLPENSPYTDAIEEQFIETIQAISQPAFRYAVWSSLGEHYIHEGKRELADKIVDEHLAEVKKLPNGGWTTFPKSLFASLLVEKDPDLALELIEGCKDSERPRVLSSWIV